MPPVVARKARNARELTERLGKMRVGWSAPDRAFAIEAMGFIAERLFAIEKRLTPPPKAPRQPSAWQRFFAEGMKAGKSPAQIGREWRERKVRQIS